MNDAISVRTKQKVHAEDLARRRWWRAEDFVCPGCRNPVYLRRGTERAPHFAHYHGYDTAHCSYYHAGRSADGDGSVRTSEPSPLPLFVQIRRDTQGRPLWNLQLAIPRLESPQGRITVVDGLSGSTPLDCSELVTEGKRILVRPQLAAYRVDVTKDVSDADADRLLVGSPGLRSDTPTLFRAGLTGGRRLSDDADLVWGEPYLAIWESGWPTSFPVNVAYQELATLAGGYRGGVFQLPLQADERVADWVAETLGRGVSAPDVTLGIVSPLTESGLDDEVAVDSREEVVVAISARGGTARLQSLVVDDDAGIVRRYHLQPGAEVLFVSLGPVGQRRVRVSAETCDGQREAEFEIDGQLRQTRLAAPLSLLVTRRMVSGQTARIPLYSRAAATALIHVRDAEESLEDFVLPPSVSCAVYTERQMFRTPPNMDLESKRLFIERLRALLSEGHGFTIDAGSFGYVVVPARLSASGLAFRNARLTSDLIHRIRVLTNLALARGSAPSILLDSHLSAQLAAVVALLLPKDARVVECFARRPWSIELLPQARALAAEITRGGAKASKM